MNKREFLETLRQALVGEVNQDIIDQNIKYYDDYISTHFEYDEAAILHELGDPRLIAKTIIETERISKEKVKYTSSEGYSRENYYGEREDQKDENGYKDAGPRRNTIFLNHMSWYQRVIIYAILFLVLLIIFFIGRFLIRLLFAFAVPLLLMFIIFRLFKRR